MNRLKHSLFWRENSSLKYYASSSDAPPTICSRFPSMQGIFLSPHCLVFLQAKYQSKKSVIVNLSRSPTTRSDPSEFSNDSVTNVTSSSTTVTATATAVLNDPGSSGEPNILQVYAAYDTGLASGTSVKLTVTKDTTAREVIDLVIKQLNMAVILKGINLKITLCICAF